MIEIKPNQKWRSLAGETIIVLNVSPAEVEVYNVDPGFPTLINCRMVSASELRANFQVVPRTSNWRNPSKKGQGPPVFTWAILSTCCVVCWFAIEGEPKNYDLVDCYLHETQQHVPTPPEFVLRDAVAKCQHVRIDRNASGYRGWS